MFPFSATATAGASAAAQSSSGRRTKLPKLAAVAALALAGLTAPTPTLFAAGAGAATAAADAASVVVVPPLKVVKQAEGLVPAGDWKAPVPAAALDYAATKKRAQDAEAAGKVAEALTAWERVIDRTPASEEGRAEARARIKVLRPKVAVNTDPAKAKKWKVLALVYQELDFEAAGRDEKPARFQQKMTKKNLDTIGKELAGWRDLTFEYSSGQVLLEIDAVVVPKPVTKMNNAHGGYVLEASHVAGDAQREFAKKKGKYDTVISYVKYRGDKGKAGLPRPRFTAATISRARQLGGAGYIIIPWGENYPYVGRGELWGEMELHEWLHQIDTVIQGGRSSLGYPKGVAQNPDMGSKDPEYVRTPDVRTWAYFYKHIMAEHITRQVWTEITTGTGAKPGAVIGQEQGKGQGKERGQERRKGKKA
jgi:hypothetical protein